MTTRLVANRLRFASWLIVLGALCFTAFAFAKRCHYAGKPFEDSIYHRGPQHIPGRVMCAFYDLGGEGVAYHDSDAKNNGSGALNPADGTYLNQFRMNEGVDTSYTKFLLKISRRNRPQSLQSGVAPGEPAVGRLGRAGRVVQHDGAGAAERRIHWRPAVFLDRRRIYRVRCKWKTSRSADHGLADLQPG
jgi:hypothetical protein